MKRYRIRLEGHTYDITVLDDPRQEQVRVEVDGEIFTVGVEDVSIAGKGAGAEVASSTASPPVPASPASSTGVVTAPLPGIIKSVAVRPGQRVARNDELLVIEAMKMDNTIRAQREGIIGAVHVIEGHQVAYGDPLLEFAD